MRRLVTAAPAQTQTPEVRVHNVDELNAAALQADVCIVGSGPAGAVLAKQLADRGIDTLLIESGPPRGSAQHPARIKPLDVYQSAGEIDYPVAITRFRGAGGTSNLWSGNCPRFYPLDFEPNPYTPANAPWPIRYEELEPYYTRAEGELRVGCGQQTRFAPARSAPFPRAVATYTPNVQRLLRQSAHELACQLLPRSDWEGKPVNTAVTHLPGFSTSPHGRLVCGATVTRILCEDDGRVSGLELRTADRAPRTVEARAYVIACGGIESTRLLLLSRSARFPNGLGNHSDLVGRCFMEHPGVAAATGTVRGVWNPLSSPELVSCDQFLTEAKHLGFGGVRLGLRTDRPRLDFDSNRPLQVVWDGVRAMRELNIALKAEIEMEPCPENRIRLDGSHSDGFGNPGTTLSMRFTDNDRKTTRYCAELIQRVLTDVGAERITEHTVRSYGWGHHHMGTCRMGDDPGTSVVDRNLAVHGADNVYIAGSAPFVTSSISNPTLTIVALSLRLADHLTEKLRPTVGASLRRAGIR
jgi:choline dehydrogenase-like flavoprotein